MTLKLTTPNEVVRKVVNFFLSLVYGCIIFLFISLYYTIFTTIQPYNLKYIKYNIKIMKHPFTTTPDILEFFTTPRLEVVPKFIIGIL